MAIKLEKHHYTFENGVLGSIHTSSNYFLDVERETEKAVLIQMYGKTHWLPKSAFVGKKFGDMIVFDIKPFFYNQIMNKF